MSETTKRERIPCGNCGEPTDWRRVRHDNNKIFHTWYCRDCGYYKTRDGWVDFAETERRGLEQLGVNLK